jgi:uncharacterized protein YdeI (YjbR/CyaY-like superfamily)
MTDPVYFKDQYEFREWLEKNHKSAREIIVGYYKVKTGKLSLTWSESVDQALCFGWIDGIRRSIDQDRYCIRFTPRKPGSNWSNINIKKILELKRKGLMTKKGIEAFKKRKNAESGSYSFEQGDARLNMDLETIFKSNPGAWNNFQKMAPSYRRTVLHWIMSAKQESTRINRLAKLISATEKNEKIY